MENSKLMTFSYGKLKVNDFFAWKTQSSWLVRMENSMVPLWIVETISGSVVPSRHVRWLIGRSRTGRPLLRSDLIRYLRFLADFCRFLMRFSTCFRQILMVFWSPQPPGARQWPAPWNSAANGVSDVSGDGLGAELWAILCLHFLALRYQFCEISD